MIFSDSAFVEQTQSVMKAMMDLDKSQKVHSSKPASAFSVAVSNSSFKAADDAVTTLTEHLLSCSDQALRQFATEQEKQQSVKNLVFY